MKIKDLELVQELNAWEINRVNRLNTEKKFAKFTGLMHVIELHAPFTKWDYAFDMVKAARKYPGKKILFSAGDSINGDMLSYFYRTNNCRTTKTPVEEIAMVIKFLKYAQKTYDHIIVMKSNHEKRLEKFILRNAGELVQARAALEMMKTLRDLFVAQGLEVTFVDDYFFMVGDAIVSHIENNSTVPGAICRQLVQYLTPRIEKDWKAIYQAHTHTQSRMPIDRKLMIETGACVDSLDYWRSGRMLGKGKMSSIGYARGEFKKGEVIIDTADFVLCGWEGYL